MTRLVSSFSRRMVKRAALALAASALMTLLSASASAEPTIIETKPSKPPRRVLRTPQVLQDGRRVTTMLDVFGVHPSTKTVRDTPTPRPPPERKHGGTADVVVEEKHEVPNS